VRKQRHVLLPEGGAIGSPPNTREVFLLSLKSFYFLIFIFILVTFFGGTGI
jgi:hypothetical protein